jgi:hypothetical protein
VLRISLSMLQNFSVADGEDISSSDGPWQVVLG